MQWPSNAILSSVTLRCCSSKPAFVQTQVAPSTGDNQELHNNCDRSPESRPTKSFQNHSGRWTRNEWNHASFNSMKMHYELPLGIPPQRAVTEWFACFANLSNSFDYQSWNRANAYISVLQGRATICLLIKRNIRCLNGDFCYMVHEVMWHEIDKLWDDVKWDHQSTQTCRDQLKCSWTFPNMK